jgi:hypothetical protein
MSAFFLESKLLCICVKPPGHYAFHQRPIHFVNFFDKGVHELWDFLFPLLDFDFHKQLFANHYLQHPW